MISFESDYICGAHETVLNKLIETNLEPLSGYGDDKYTKSAKEKIKKACQKDVEVFFLNGGTQTNQVVIDSVLSQYEGVICANSGHINTHEAGAIEFTGHKVISLPHKDGKIEPKTLLNYMTEYYCDENYEHTTIPGMVYISHPTEYGTLYTKNELSEISSICKKYDLDLYLDGARLGYGLMSESTDVTLQDIALLCDEFYIGGTKVGALCGEAVVFTHDNSPKHFFTSIKQHGALLAKGRLLGVQFDTLFTDDLYFKISKHAIDMANMLRDAFIQKRYELYIKNDTNQIFIVLENNKLNELSKSVKFGFWEIIDDSHTVVRFATSWATTIDEVNKLISIL